MFIIKKSLVSPRPADMWYLSPLVCLLFLALIPLWVVVAQQSPQTKEVLRSGWQPVIVAMSISRYIHLDFQFPSFKLLFEHKNTAYLKM